jgi:hypothetical protein
MEDQHPALRLMSARVKKWTDYADWVERYSTSPENWSKFALIARALAILWVLARARV